MDLKEQVIYQLPNGRELIARLSGENKPVLHELSMTPQNEYELNQEGRLVLHGHVTAWDVDDLLETGRTGLEQNQ